MAEEFDRTQGRFVGGASQEVAEHDDQAVEDRQPKQDEDPWANVNLDEIPSFRSYKSTMDKKLSQRDEILAQERRQREALQRQYEQDRMAGMNAEQKANYRAELAERRALEAEERLQLMEAAERRDRILKEIADEAGIPVSALQDAEDPVDAVRRAVSYRNTAGQERSTERQQYERERRAANRVDIGAGSPPGVQDELQRKYDKAKENYDSGGMLDAMFEADKAGVLLREH